MQADIRLLTFDLDDTLWPCEQTILAAEQTLYDWMRQHVPQITDQYDLRTLREKRIAFHKQRHDIAHDLSQLRIESLRTLAAETGIGDDWVEQAFNVYYRARQQIRLYDDVAPVLDRLKTEYRMVAVTNGNADIGATGVAHWFEFAVNAAQVGRAKPHPAFFETVLEKAGVEAQHTIHVGDDPHHDIYGAISAGIRSIWVNRRGEHWAHEEFCADVHVTSFAELPQALQQLQA